jgi:hypothetical protein
MLKPNCVLVYVFQPGVGEGDGLGDGLGDATLGVGDSTLGVGRITGPG